MKKLLSLLLIATLPSIAAFAQSTELTTAQAKSLYKATSKRWVSIHDPSVVYEPKTKRYYIFGSHKAGAYTTDFQNWTQANPTWQPNDNAQAFITPAMKKVRKGGQEVDLPQFNAMAWSAKGSSNYNVNGNMWAPDVIWNEKMQKWCMYLSINGDAWYSSIILLTANNITGPYTYQGPVVISGFYSGSNYKSTDLELVLGTQSSLPSRYNVGGNWGKRWPNNIDPAVFYDEDGKLWLVYGSWSGGIWMLELDEETGLRDYDVTYPSTNGNSDGVTSDPYFGTKIAGGYYVSGEGPYIEHIGNYYYLFVSYGFFSPDGGYEMRVFRSDKPSGPYKDASNRSAIFTGYVMNYGTGSSDMRGEKIMGAYNKWGFQTVGECAQGHNSIIAAEDGRTYLVYHTKFNNGTDGHQVRVHQVFLNKEGWLVAAPFEYNGEAVTDQDIAAKELVSDVDLPGTYQLIVHKYRMDYKNMEEVTPVEVTLTADGKVTGPSASYNGTWSREAGSSYFTIKLGSYTYQGVVYEEQMDRQSLHTVSFTAMTPSGINVWGYKLHPKYALAWQVNNQKMSLYANKNIDENNDLDALWLGDPNVSMLWTTDQPAVISEHGLYNPAGLTEDTDVTLAVKLSAGDYYWHQQYTVKARTEENAAPAADWQTGMVAHYSFDGEELANSLDASQKALLASKSTTKAPVVEQDYLHRGIVHTAFGANGKESYVSVANPLKGLDLTKGATISFWTRLTGENLWDALFGVTDGKARFFITGNAFIGYNDGDSKNWIDINNPNDATTGYFTPGTWHFITVTIRKNGLTLYVDGASKAAKKVNGKLDDKTVSSASAFDYGYVLSLLTTANELCLGNGSYWGSQDACFDGLTIHSEALTTTARVQALKKMMNRVNSLSPVSTDISEVTAGAATKAEGIYDLQGRRVENPQRGLYIVNGRKVIIR